MRRLTPGKRTLGQLAKAAGLARASLLYYESLGLLTPAGRSAAGYRLYGEAELERLRTIRQFREAGLPLATIRILLAESEAKSAKETAGPAELLEARLLGMCKEVERLRNQQKLLARLLATREFRAGRPCKDKDAWVALLRSAGFSEEDMQHWHADFEASHPDEHAAFLASLGLAPREVAKIRHWSRVRK